MLRLAFVTDIHMGPEASFEGKLRKLSAYAGPLLEQSVARVLELGDRHGVVQMGDAIEDESPELDSERYGECLRILRTAGLPLINVAGNHDTIFMGQAEINQHWQRQGHLYFSFDLQGYHIVVLHTVETKDVDVHLDGDQLQWLKEDLEATSLPTVVLVHHPVSEQDLSDTRWFSKVPHLALVAERKAVRQVLEASGKVKVVLNGHVHRNHVQVIGGIPYISLQSLTENLDDDAPGRPSEALGLLDLDAKGLRWRVEGEDALAFELQF